MTKDRSKPTLVVIEALLGFVIDCANIDHNIAGFQDSGIARPFKTLALVSIPRGGQ